MLLLLCLLRGRKKKRKNAFEKKRETRAQKEGTAAAEEVKGAVCCPFRKKLSTTHRSKREGELPRGHQSQAQRRSALFTKKGISSHTQKGAGNDHAKGGVGREHADVR